MKAKEKRTEAYLLKLSKAEKKKLQTESEKQGIPVAQIIRQYLINNL